MPLSPVIPVSIAQRSALPERLDAFIDRAVQQGAAPYPLVELNNRVPTLGPYVMQGSGSFQLLVYGGPLMSFRLQPTLGAHVNTQA